MFCHTLINCFGFIICWSNMIFSTRKCSSFATAKLLISFSLRISTDWLEYVYILGFLLKIYVQKEFKVFFKEILVLKYLAEILYVAVANWSLLPLNECTRWSSFFCVCVKFLILFFVFEFKIIITTARTLIKLLFRKHQHFKFSESKVFAAQLASTDVLFIRAIIFFNSPQVSVFLLN